MGRLGDHERMRPARSAVLLIALFSAGCQAEPSPTVLTRTMTATIPIPVAGKAAIDAAEAVFSERLKALGITQFTVTSGETMRFTMHVPLAIDDEVVDAVLHHVGLFQFVPWPDGKTPAPGDPVPAGLQPLFDDPTEFQSATVITDSAAGQPGIDFTLGPVGREAIATYTTQHIGSALPFVLDGFVLTAPIINGAITGGVMRVTGPQDEFPIPLAAMAAMMASGPLPAEWR